MMSALRIWDVIKTIMTDEEACDYNVSIWISDTSGLYLYEQSPLADQCCVVLRHVEHGPVFFPLQE